MLKIMMKWNLKAMKEHEEILKLLKYYDRKVSKQSFLDDTNNRGRKNRKVIEECIIYLHIIILKQ